MTRELSWTVKYEHVYLQAYDSPKALRSGLEDYFEVYNHEHFHQCINYDKPKSLYE